MREFDKIIAPSIRELFVEKLARMILAGELRPGERLPSERDLAQQMGIGKTVVHEGLNELARDGFLTIRPQAGVYVADYLQTGNLETFNAIVRYSGGDVDPAIISEMLDFRLAVEGFALRRLAEKRTADDIRTLKDAIDGLSRRIASEELPRTVMAGLLDQFHREICRLCGSSVILLTVNAIRDVSLMLFTKYLTVAPSYTAVINELFQLVELLDQRDGDGAYHYLEQMFLQGEKKMTNQESVGR